MKLDSHTYSNFEPLNQQSFKAQGLKKIPKLKKGENTSVASQITFRVMARQPLVGR
jgi:hypothetical protein